jgi:GNAT superfamily N-acetyltransferase
LLRRVDERLKNQGRRLLVVLDQFEEFFVFYERSRAQLAPLLGLLADLRREPLENVRLLLTLRSDYLEDIAWVEELPRLEQDRNWKQVGPFTETEARAFLRAGFQGPGLGAELIAAVVRHASELDETRGKVRPVVLNMLGLALAARGGQAGRVLNPREAQRLMFDHVREGLNDPLSRDRASQLLAKMITPEGKKERPASASDLARKTGLGIPLVQGCLARLNLLGFVWPFDADRERSAGAQVWEVSHDFVARLLSLILPAWKPSLWSRLRRGLGPALMGLGIVAVFALMQLHLDRERKRHEHLQH